MEDNKISLKFRRKKPFKFPIKRKNGESSLASALDVLSRFGGFNFLESTVDGVQNLNPERKARKKDILNR